MLSFQINVPRGMKKEMKKMMIAWVERCQHRVANKVTNNVKQVFELEGARGDNPKWKPVTAVARKFRQVNPNAPTLVDSGRLKNSIYATVHKDSKAVYVVIGSDLRYLYEHNNGEHDYTPPIERGNWNGKTYLVPQRRILFLVRQDELDVRNIFKNTALRFR